MLRLRLRKRLRLAERLRLRLGKGLWLAELPRLIERLSLAELLRLRKRLLLVKLLHLVRLLLIELPRLINSFLPQMPSRTPYLLHTRHRLGFLFRLIQTPSLSARRCCLQRFVAVRGFRCILRFRSSMSPSTTRRPCSRMLILAHIHSLLPPTPTATCLLTSSHAASGSNI